VPFSVAVIVTAVDVLTAEVLIVKVPITDPPPTMTVAGRVADDELDDSATG